MRMYVPVCECVPVYMYVCIGVYVRFNHSLPDT